MASELQKYSGYYDRKTAHDMDYRGYMEKQAMVKDIGTAIQRSTDQQMIMTSIVGSNITQRIDQSTDRLQGQMVRMQTGITAAINTQTFAVIASQAALARTFKEGFDQVNNTLDMGFSGISSQLGSMTAAFSAGLDRVADNLKRMSKDICDRLDAIHDIVNNPLLTQSRELYRRAVENYNKGFYEEALEDIKAAVEKNKTDYISWFLMGKLYLFGAGEFSNIINLDAAIETLTNSAKYISPDISANEEAKLMAAEIWFYIGLARYNKFNDLNFHKQEAEAKTALEESLQAFDRCWNYSVNMLEACYNKARCKVLMGNTEGAIKDLETAIALDRNYCLKVFSDSDFDSVQDDYINLIERRKKDKFANVKEHYAEINDILTGINNLNGILSKEQENLLFENVSSEPAENEPYFDILDKAGIYSEILRTFTQILDDLQSKRKQEAQESKRKNAFEEDFLSQVKEDIKKITELPRSNGLLNKQDWEFIMAKEKEYYVDAPYTIPKKDVESIIKFEDGEKPREGNMEHYTGEYSKDLISDPKSMRLLIFTLKHILNLSEADFLEFFDNIYTKPRSYNFQGCEIAYLNKLTMKPSLIAKFQVLRANKELAEQLISTIQSAIWKQQNQNTSNDNKKLFITVVVPLLLLIGSIVVGVLASSFWVGLIGVIIAVVLFIIFCCVLH